MLGKSSRTFIWYVLFLKFVGVFLIDCLFVCSFVCLPKKITRSRGAQPQPGLQALRNARSRRRPGHHCH